MPSIPMCSPTPAVGELPSDLTSLEPLETTRLQLLCQTACQRHVHARFQAQRKQIYSALADDPTSRFLRRCLRISNCCAFPVIWIGPDGQPEVSLGRCRDRLCPFCSIARAHESGARVEALLRTMDSPRFMTLTVPHCDDDLRVQLDRIMVQLRELRKTSAWRRYVLGGVWSLEITYNRTTGQWHPHVHIVFDGSYFPQPELKQEWSRIQAAESIVDVRQVVSRRAAARYIAKYVSKALQVEDWPDGKITEYANATHRRRTIHTFGSCHGISTEADPVENQPAPSQRTVGVWVLRRRIALGDAITRRHAEALACTGPLLRCLLEVGGEELGLIPESRREERLVEAVSWLKSLDPCHDWLNTEPSPPHPPTKPTVDRTPLLMNVR